MADLVHWQFTAAYSQAMCVETRGKERSEKLDVFAHLSSLLNLSLLKCVGMCKCLRVCAWLQTEASTHTQPNIEAHIYTDKTFVDTIRIYAYVYKYINISVARKCLRCSIEF